MSGQLSQLPFFRTQTSPALKPICWIHRPRKLPHHFYPQMSLEANPQKLLLEAKAYSSLFHHECGMLEAYPERLTRMQAEIERTGTYWHTYEELAYGAKIAWRNNTRCIGRLHWKSLAVRDMRHLETAEEIFTALVEHLRLATNGGKIRSMITIFAPAVPELPGIRIWNPQLIRYAGYRQPNGSIVGEPCTRGSRM